MGLWVIFSPFFLPKQGFWVWRARISLPHKGLKKSWIVWELRGSRESVEMGAGWLGGESVLKDGEVNQSHKLEAQNSGAWGIPHRPPGRWEVQCLRREVAPGFLDETASPVPSLEQKEGRLLSPGQVYGLDKKHITLDTSELKTWPQCSVLSKILLKLGWLRSYVGNGIPLLG